MKPMPFQSEDVKHVERQFRHRGLFAWDAGLGKTFAALWWLKRNLDIATPAVVVVPASIKWQWAREAKKIAGLEALVLEGQRGEPIDKKTELVIVNYDILKKPKSRAGKEWLHYLRLLRPKTLVLDEIQYTANTGTKRTRACEVLARKCKNVIGLSATPLLNKPLEMFAGLRMIKPTQFPSRYHFAQRYCDPLWTPWGWTYKGVSHAEELHKLLLDTCMVRRRKIEVLDQFPPKVRNVVTLPLKDPREYRQATVDFMGWLKKKDAEKAKQISRTGGQALFKIGVLLRMAARLKMRFANQWITEFLNDSDEKLIVFANHRKAIQSLKKNVPVKSVVIDGSVTGRKRLAAVDQFVTDPDTRLFVGNTKAAGTGTDGLQSAARNVVFCELPWQPGQVLQAEDRAWRIGTTDKVWVWFLVAAGTIEERLCEILQEKQEGLSAILDGGRTEGDLDILDQLVFELEN